MKKLIFALIAAAIISSTSVALALSQTPYVQAQVQEGAEAARGNDQPANLFNIGGDEGVFTTVVNILLFLIGAISVIMIIIGGIRYAVSGGNSSAVSAAKNTILYAIVGIIVAVLAFAIVNFVLEGLLQGTTGGGTGNGTNI